MRSTDRLSFLLLAHVAHARYGIAWFALVKDMAYLSALAVKKHSGTPGLPFRLLKESYTGWFFRTPRGY